MGFEPPSSDAQLAVLPAVRAAFMEWTGCGLSDNKSSLWVSVVRSSQRLFLCQESSSQASWLAVPSPSRSSETSCPQEKPSLPLQSCPVSIPAPCSLFFKAYTTPRYFHVYKFVLVGWWPVAPVGMEGSIRSGHRLSGSHCIPSTRTQHMMGTH